MRESVEKEMKKIKNKLEGKERDVCILREFACEEKKKFETMELELLREKE